MMAATMAGIAFSNASVALVHGMSRPIGVFFHVPHGLSNAMLLPAVTAFSADAAAERYADCARAMGVAGAADPDVRRHQEAGRCAVPEEPGAAGALAEAIRDPRAAVFRSIPVMAAQALASGSPQNNPRIPTADEIAQLYRQVWA